MDAIVLDSIPFELNQAQLRDKLHIKEGSDHAEELQELAEKALEIGSPRAITKMAFIEFKTDDEVVIDGVKFASRVLRVNLDEAHRVFAYVATCGIELQRWGESLNDLLHRFWADEIKVAALYSATRYLDKYLNDQFQLGKMSRMSPGSLADWPLREQRPLFNLLGDPQAAIGVELTQSFLMVPNKSVSGIRFPAESSFESCQLCSREGCPGRRAPYDSELYERKYRQKN
jgi:hypothetical protein